MRFFKASLFALAALFLVARLALAAVCPGCGTKSKDGVKHCPACGTELPAAKKPEPKKPEPKKPEPKKPEPKKPEPKKPEPKKPEPGKPEPKRPDKRAMAKRYYDAAMDRYRKAPTDYDGALKGFALALKGCAGTRYASRCEKMIARVKGEKKAAADAEARAKAKAAREKAEREAAAREAKARSAYETAYSSYRKNRRDHAGNIKKFEEARKLGTGTKYEKSCDRMLARLKAEKKDAEARAAREKAEAEKKAKLAKAQTTYDAAYAAYRKNRKDLDGNIARFEEAKKVGAGTGYDRKAQGMLVRLRKEKAKLAASKPEPKKPEPKKPEPKKPEPKKPEPKKPEPKKPEPKKPEPKKPEPKKPEPKKPEPKKVDPRAEYRAAVVAYKKNPRAYDANIKLFQDTKKKVAGSRYERSCDKLIAGLKADKVEAEKKARALKARAAFDAAYTQYKKNRTDFDGNIAKFEEVKKLGAGTGYDRKAEKMLVRIKAEKAKAAPKKPEPKKPEPKKPEPKKPEPKKPEPKKPTPKEIARQKQAKAKASYNAAYAAYKKNPGDLDAGIKVFETARKDAAGTRYASSCDKMIRKLTEEKNARAAKEKSVKARAAFEAAYTQYKKNRTDFDGNIAKFEEAKKLGAGTGYDRKAEKMLVRIKAEKAKAAPKKPEPKKPEPKKPEPKKPEPKKPEPKKPEPKKPAPKKPEPKKPVARGPITPFVTGKVRAKSPADAFARARQMEAKGQTPREKAELALPYYYAAVTMKVGGKRGKDAAAAALRIGELVEAQGDGKGDLASAAKYYLISAILEVDSDAWRKADRLYVKLGKKGTFVKRLGLLAGKAEKAGKPKLAAELRARAKELSK